MCSCVVIMAAAAQDTAMGALVAAAGVAAEILIETASASRNITWELLSDSRDLSVNSICAAAW